MLHSLSLGVSLFVLWLLLSGHGEPLLIGLGILSSIGTVLIARRMDVIDREGHPIHLTAKIPFYWLWLLWEIVKSNLQVARLILTPRLPVSPQVFHVVPSQKSELGHVIYANSITLTPGTVTIGIDGSRFAVHALDDAFAAGVLDAEMDRRVTAVEGLSRPAGKAR